MIRTGQSQEERILLLPNSFRILQSLSRGDGTFNGGRGTGDGGRRTGETLNSSDGGVKR
jgi:hypothetical protein